MPDVHRLVTQWVMGGGAQALGLSLWGGSWREATGKSMLFYFPAGVGKGVGTSPPDTGASGQMGEPNCETMQCG